MKKMKRYKEGDYVTSDDSNSGMKEARDEIDAEIARTPSSDYGDYMPESSSQTVTATPKTAAKTKSAAKPADKPKEKKANFTSAETGGGAALMYRKPMRKAGSSSTDTRSTGKKSSGNTVDFGGFGLGMKSGGSASSRADGIATKGKTRGKMC